MPIRLWTGYLFNKKADIIVPDDKESLKVFNRAKANEIQMSVLNVATGCVYEGCSCNATLQAYGLTLCHKHANLILNRVLNVNVSIEELP